MGNPVQNARQILQDQEADYKRLADETRSKLLLQTVERQNPGQTVDQVLTQQLSQMQQAPSSSNPKRGEIQLV